VPLGTKYRIDIAYLTARHLRVTFGFSTDILSLTGQMVVKPLKAWLLIKLEN